MSLTSQNRPYAATILFDRAVEQMSARAWRG
jgi:hypothetical protein